MDDYIFLQEAALDSKLQDLINTINSQQNPEKRQRAIEAARIAVNKRIDILKNSAGSNTDKTRNAQSLIKDLDNAQSAVMDFMNAYGELINKFSEGYNTAEKINNLTQDAKTLYAGLVNIKPPASGGQIDKNFIQQSANNLVVVLRTFEESFYSHIAYAAEEYTQNSRNNMARKNVSTNVNGLRDAVNDIAKFLSPDNSNNPFVWIKNYLNSLPEKGFMWIDEKEKAVFAAISKALSDDITGLFGRAATVMKGGLDKLANLIRDHHESKQKKTEEEAALKIAFDKADNRILPALKEVITKLVTPVDENGQKRYKNQSELNQIANSYLSQIQNITESFHDIEIVDDDVYQEGFFDSIKKGWNTADAAVQDWSKNLAQKQANNKLVTTNENAISKGVEKLWNEIKDMVRQEKPDDVFNFMKQKAVDIVSAYTGPNAENALNTFNTETQNVESGNLNPEQRNPTEHRDEAVRKNEIIDLESAGKKSLREILGIALNPKLNIADKIKRIKELREELVPGSTPPTTAGSTPTSTPEPTPTTAGSTQTPVTPASTQSGILLTQPIKQSIYIPQNSAEAYRNREQVHESDEIEIVDDVFQEEDTANPSAIEKPTPQRAIREIIDDGYKNIDFNQIYNSAGSKEAAMTVVNERIAGIVDKLIAELEKQDNSSDKYIMNWKQTIKGMQETAQEIYNKVRSILSDKRIPDYAEDLTSTDGTTYKNANNKYKLLSDYIDQLKQEADIKSSTPSPESEFKPRSDSAESCLEAFHNALENFNFNTMVGTASANKKTPEQVVKARVIPMLERIIQKLKMNGVGLQQGIIAHNEGYKNLCLRMMPRVRRLFYTNKNRRELIEILKQYKQFADDNDISRLIGDKDPFEESNHILDFTKIEILDDIYIEGKLLDTITGFGKGVAEKAGNAIRGVGEKIQGKIDDISNSDAYQNFSKKVSGIADNARESEETKQAIATSWDEISKQYIHPESIDSREEFCKQVSQAIGAMIEYLESRPDTQEVPEQSSEESSTTATPIPTPVSAT